MLSDAKHPQPRATPASSRLASQPWRSPKTGRPNDSGSQPPAAVVALVNDLFFASRIAQALKQLDCLGAIETRADLFEQAIHSRPPALALVDLGIRGVDWADTVRRLRADPRLASVPIIAFGPHRDLDARQRALAAGCTEVVANSKLVADLPRILAKHLGNR